LDVERIWIEITRWHCPHKAYGLMNFSEAIQNMDHRIIALIFLWRFNRYRPWLFVSDARLRHISYDEF
jgi:hypothetical protein